MALRLQEWHDQPSWDAFVGSQGTGHFNQGWGWGEVSGPLGGAVCRLAVVDDGRIVAAMSVVANPIRRSRINQLYVSRGPAVDAVTDEIFDLLDEGMASLGQNRSAILTKIEANVPAGNRAWARQFGRTGFEPLFPPSQPRSTWILDLQPDLDTLLTGMKPKWRYNIRLGGKKGVEVMRGTRDNIPQFYELYKETSARDRFYIHDRSIYEFIFETFWSLNQFELLLACYKGRPVAAVTLVHLGKYAYYLNGASTSQHREVMAPHLLQWEAIKWSKERGAEMYDFRGVPDVPAVDQDMYGVYRFKQGFGGRHVTYMETVAKPYNRPAYQLWRTYWQGRFMSQAARRRMKGLPSRQWA